jgi:hypothetical protein
MTGAFHFVIHAGACPQWVFLPTLVTTIPALVAVKGGDALSVCFNTVAVLFLWYANDSCVASFLFVA